MTMKIARFTAALALAASFAFPALAQQEERVKAELKKRIPEAPVDSVRKINFGGLYEVVAGGEIYYTDEGATFDREVVLDGGEVKETGRHEELLRRPNGLYNRLYELQFTPEDPAL